MDDIKDSGKLKELRAFTIRIVLYRREGLIVKNICHLSSERKINYDRIVKCKLNEIGIVVQNYHKLFGETFQTQKPLLLCKYMPKEYAISNIISSSVRFSSVGYYRMDDPDECRISVNFDDCVYDDMDGVVSRLMMAVMEERQFDYDSIWNSIQEIVEKRLFVGCFTDGQNEDKMWKDYAKGDGVCVWFEPDYSNLHMILYKDYLTSLDNLKKQYMGLMVRLSKEDYYSVKDDLNKMVEELVNISIMSHYVKKPDYADESEWRVLVTPSIDEIKTDDSGNRYIIHPIPGKIVKIESRMPDDFNDRLSSLLDSDIEYVIRGPEHNHN